MCCLNIWLLISCYALVKYGVFYALVKYGVYIKMHLRDIGLYGMDWIDVAQDRDQWRALMNTVMNLRVL
jgi:hypothetical protein